jgi:hypothetical protein
MKVDGFQDAVTIKTAENEHGVAETAKTADAPPPAALPCPYRDNHGRIFQDSSQLLEMDEMD